MLLSCELISAVALLQIHLCEFEIRGLPPPLPLQEQLEAGETSTCASAQQF